MIFDGNKSENIKLAAETLRAGNLVAFPTETVYGLGADARNPSAIEKIFRVKGRPFTDPLIVHIASEEQFKAVTAPLSEKVQSIVSRLSQAFWPGPLTLVLRKNSSVPDEATAGLETVGVRWPEHKVALELLRAFDGPIAAPSANRFQSISPTTVDAVDKELGSKVLLILDGGPCRVGLESTIVRVGDVAGAVEILRLGGVTLEALESVLGYEPAIMNESLGGIVHAPGTLEFHYAPTKPLRLFNESELAARMAGLTHDELKRTGLLAVSRAQVPHSAPFGRVVCLSEAGDLGEAARNLFSSLRKLDESDVEAIYSMKAPDMHLGRVLNDRLKRAQHGL